jgi:hypothetical protein
MTDANLRIASLQLTWDFHANDTVSKVDFAPKETGQRRLSPSTTVTASSNSSAMDRPGPRATS